ncbi:hypothetical protein IQ07DRAFT_591055 [Pyrenochaeta sp. DS3sAY3a]|nr:hypothetical protein IQ07DRAFT_591055 [Pyrenochaeta sp. DS3sAY3a]
MAPHHHRVEYPLGTELAAHEKYNGKEGKNFIGSLSLAMLSSMMAVVNLWDLRSLRVVTLRLSRQSMDKLQRIRVFHKPARNRVRS